MSTNRHYHVAGSNYSLHITTDQDRSMGLIVEISGLRCLVAAANCRLRGILTRNRQQIESTAPWAV